MNMVSPSVAGEDEVRQHGPADLDPETRARIEHAVLDVFSGR